MLPHSPDVVCPAWDRDKVPQTPDDGLDKFHHICVVSDDAYHMLKDVSQTKLEKTDDDGGDKMSLSSSKEIHKEKRQINDEQIVAKTKTAERSKSPRHCHNPESLRKNESSLSGHFDAKHYEFISVTNSIRHRLYANVRCTTCTKIKGVVVCCRCRMHANEYYNFDCKLEWTDFCVKFDGNTFSPAELGKCLLEDGKYVTCSSSTTLNLVTTLPNRAAFGQTGWGRYLYGGDSTRTSNTRLWEKDASFPVVLKHRPVQCLLCLSGVPQFIGESWRQDEHVRQGGQANCLGQFTLSTRGGGVETIMYRYADNDELELSTPTDFSNAIDNAVSISASRRMRMSSTNRINISKRTVRRCQMRNDFHSAMQKHAHAHNYGETTSTMDHQNVNHHPPTPPSRLMFSSFLLKKKFFENCAAASVLQNPIRLAENV